MAKAVAAGQMGAPPTPSSRPSAVEKPWCTRPIAGAALKGTSSGPASTLSRVSRSEVP